MYAIHALQLGTEQAFIENEFNKFALIKANSENNEFHFPIKVSMLEWKNDIVYEFYIALCLSRLPVIFISHISKISLVSLS